jgi:hypothetical protein
MPSTYYVSTSGSDANSGTSSSPFNTIPYAITQSSNGDTIIVISGTYNYGANTSNNVININKELTIIGRETISGTRPIINISTASENTSVLCNASNITLKGLEFVHNPATTGSNDTCINLAPGGTGIYPDSGIMVNQNINISDCKIHFTKFGVSSKAKYFSVKNCELVSKAVPNTTARSIAIYSQDGTVDILDNIFTASASNNKIELLHNNFATNDFYQNKRNGTVNFIGNITSGININRRAIFFEAGCDTGLSGDRYSFNVSNNTISTTSDCMMLLQPNSNFLNFINLITLNNNTFINNLSTSNNGLVKVDQTYAPNKGPLTTPINNPKFLIYSNTINNATLNLSTNSYNVDDKNVLIFTGFTPDSTGGLSTSVINSILNTVDPNVVDPNVTFSGTGELTQEIVNLGIGSKTQVIITGYTSIGNYAFLGKPQITSVNIPNSVLTIGTQAFYNCSGLETVTFQETSSLTSIGDYAFESCSGLTSVTIGNSVTSIGDYAFDSCTGLTSVTFQETSSVTSIGYSAFSGCSGLTNIVIPNSVTSIGDYAFEGCSGLTSVTIPNSVTTIGDSAFANCSSLTSVTFQETSSVQSIGAYAFSGCSGLTNIVIPNSVTSIGDGAFGSCSVLTSIVIPNSVISIGYAAFQNCSLLTSVTFNGNIPTIDSNNFTVGNDTAYYYEGATNTIILPTFFTNVVGPPFAPIINTVIVSSGQASIAFTPGANNGSAITNYEYSIDNDSNWVSSGTITSPISVTGLTNGTFYAFQIRAVNAMGAGDSSNSVSTLVDVLPGAPTINIVNVTSGQASITFTPGANTGSSITNYEYSIDNGSNWVARDPVNTSSPISVTGLTNGTTYAFQIRAVNAMGSGTASNSFQMLVDVASGAPTINTVIVSSGQASIAFTPGANNGSAITNYEYSIYNGSNWVARDPLNTSSPISVTGLTNGTTYAFQIRAVNAMGSGTSSNTYIQYIRPTLSQLKGINSLKSDYLLYGYILSNLVDSGSFTLKELVVIGFELSELKLYFSNDALISSRMFTGSDLKQNGIILHGIVYFDLLIISNGITEYINTMYSLTNENREIIFITILDQFGVTIQEVSSIAV